MPIDGYLDTGVAARRILAGLSVSTALAASYVFGALLQSYGVKLLDIPLFVLFVVLFLWTSVSFWTATLGFVMCLWRPATRSERVPPDLAGRPAVVKRSKTAILMPIHNECPTHVLAGLQATLESLREAGCSEGFEAFILSDTTDPETWLEEELAWVSLRDTLAGEPAVFYRRRARNTGRKSGNIADFCERWGGNYEYMVILDADSLMSATTLLELVRRMDEDPAIGILQAPVVPVGHRSFFARIQQFAAHVYGEVFTTGFALWTRADGNYWGHNAIIRVRPFMEHCGLPRLPGREPLGGEILSHDFVEAALMRRAGWKVMLADDLSGSYEECPTTLTDYAKRDQRWCQGNMQHLRLVFTYGFHPVSRIHLGTGALAYLSSSLWLLFIVLGVISGAGVTKANSELYEAERGSWLLPPAVSEHLAISLFSVTMALLLLPKLWGYLLLLRNPARLRSHGGVVRAGVSVALETIISILMAPVLMAFHVVFVVCVLLGQTVQWNAQRRTEAATSLREAVETHLTHTLAGIAALLAIALVAPGLLWWLTPVLLGLILSIPLAILLGSGRVGDWLESHGFLLIPAETQTPAILRRRQALLADAMQARQRSPRVSVLHKVVVDPAFHALHLALLGCGDEPQSVAHPDHLDRVRRIALHGGPTYLTRDHKLALLSDVPSLRWLHAAAWSHWPLDTLEAICLASQTPLESA